MRYYITLSERAGGRAPPTPAMAVNLVQLRGFLHGSGAFLSNFARNVPFGFSGGRRIG